MSNFVPFHTKLTSIMGVFVNAAVTQICELVDEGYAVLHLEISRGQKENAELREKLLKMEMGNALRGLGNITPIEHERTHVSAMSADICHSQEDDGCSNKRSLEPEFGNLCVNGDHSSTKGGHMQTNTDKSVEKISILIKEEIQEDDLDATWPETELGNCADDEDGMDMIGLNPTNHVSEDYGFEVKGGPVEQSPIQTHQHMEHQPAERSNTEFQTSLNKSPFSSPGTASEDPASCSNAADISPSYFIANTEKHMSVDDKSIGGRFPVEFHTVKPETVLMDSEAYNKSSQSNGNTLLETDNMPNSRPISRYLDNEGYGSFAERRFLNIQRNRVGRKLTIPHRHLPSIGHITGRNGNREKRYSCGFCGKSFTCPKYLQSHQRVHTGEKPFSCSQCGKRFGQAGYLKKHQNIHTGLKPYGCPLCGKRFADASNLIRHKSVHTAEKSFICIHCGERFAVKHNLKIHLERNHPAFSGTQAEDVL